jgi:copper(I)-binding protein
MVGFKLLALAACLVVAGAALAQTGQLEVSNAWAPATPSPKVENGAVYLTIRSPTPDRLLSASSPMAKN